MISVEEPTLDTNAELVWANINLLNSAPLYICSYYRPPHSDLQPILEVNESMDKLARKYPNCNFIVAGDFNNHNLEQIVNSPTRQNHILDLVLTSTPSLIKEAQTHPGMSDHEAVIFSINCECTSINRKAPCTVYLYHKRDVPSLKDEIQGFQEYFVIVRHHIPASSRHKCDPV